MVRASMELEAYVYNNANVTCLCRISVAYGSKNERFAAIILKPRPRSSLRPWIYLNLPRSLFSKVASMENILVILINELVQPVTLFKNT